eukprot:1157657-Pelagomonas_calceolata.AAC.6
MQHIALAIGEEVDLHTRLLDDLDEEVDVTQSRMKVATLKKGVPLGKVSQEHRPGSDENRTSGTPTPSILAVHECTLPIHNSCLCTYIFVYIPLFMLYAPSWHTPVRAFLHASGYAMHTIAHISMPSSVHALLCTPVLKLKHSFVP